MSEHDRQTNRVDAAKADNYIGVLWSVGLLLLVAGAVLAGAFAPGTGTDALGNPEETGDAATFATGLVIAGVGQLLVAVGVVASGVALGIRSTRT